MWEPLVWHRHDRVQAPSSGGGHTDARASPSKEGRLRARATRWRPHDDPDAACNALAQANAPLRPPRPPLAYDRTTDSNRIAQNALGRSVTCARARRRAQGGSAAKGRQPAAAARNFTHSGAERKGASYRPRTMSTTERAPKTPAGHRPSAAHLWNSAARCCPLPPNAAHRCPPPPGRSRGSARPRPPVHHLSALRPTARSLTMPAQTPPAARHGPRADGRLCPRLSCARATPHANTHAPVSNRCSLVRGRRPTARPDNMRPPLPIASSGIEKAGPAVVGKARNPRPPRSAPRCWTSPACSPRPPWGSRPGWPRRTRPPERRHCRRPG